jgi:hypothetical protein
VDSNFQASVSIGVLEFVVRSFLNVGEALTSSFQCESAINQELLFSITRLTS